MPDSQLPLSDPRAPSASRAFVGMLQRDLLVSIRRRGDLFNPMIFFLMVAALFPYGVSPDPAVLAEIAPGVLWVVALLATLLASDSLFRNDFDDGSLEQLIMSPQPLYLMVMAKVFSHWLITGLPLTLVAPLLGVMFSMPTSGLLPLMVTLLIGTGTLSFIGAIGAGLTVGLRKGGLLISLIVIPFYIPVLIFGAGAVQSAIAGYSIVAELAVLGAFLILAITLAPLATAGALRISLNG